MKIILTTNPQNPRAVALARHAAAYLQGKASVLVSRESMGALSDGETTSLETFDGDAVVCFGGDGSLLYTARRCRSPILSVNAGSMGFLSEVEADERSLERSLDSLLKGDFRVESRMRLAGQVGTRPVPDALNEILVHSDVVGKLRTWRVSMDGMTVGDLQSDGLILATPTGSTSYALSAGGPVVDPSVEALLLVPLAPFPGPARPLVLGPWHEVQVELQGARRGGVVVSDGQESVPLPEGSGLQVWKSPDAARLIRFDSRFLQRLARSSLLGWPR